MTTRLFSNPRPHFTLDDGATSNINGKLYFYEPGIGSTTLKYVYSKSPFIAANRLTNPVNLDGNGFAPTIMLDGDYRVKLTDKDGVTIWDVPNYQEPEEEGQFGDWVATRVYAAFDFVRGANGIYYQSLTSNNVGNNPTLSPSAWSEKFFTSVWNTNETYALNATVQYNGDIYKSLQASNNGNQPDISSSYWSNISPIADYVAGRSYSTNDIVKYLGAIYVSIQNSNVGNTPDSSPSWWRSLFEPTIITSYTAAGFEYRSSDGYNTTAYNAGVFITDGSFESVGPTGSGADNIWSAMDDMPPGSRMAIFIIRASATRSGTTDDALSFVANARQTGGAATENFCQVMSLRDYGGDAAAARIDGTMEICVPVDSSNRFDFRYSFTNATSANNVAIYFVGYKI